MNKQTEEILRIFPLTIYKTKIGLTDQERDLLIKEVQRANMSKLGEDGKPIYNEKGKVMKGPNYLEPNLKQFVE